MMLDASGMFADSAKVQYLCTLLRGEALCQLATFSVKVGIISITHLNHIILGLGAYFSPINALSEQKRSMRRGMRKPRELKAR